MSLFALSRIDTEQLAKELHVKLVTKIFEKQLIIHEKLQEVERRQSLQVALEDTRAQLELAQRDLQNAQQEKRGLTMVLVAGIVLFVGITISSKL